MTPRALEQMARAHGHDYGTVLEVWHTLPDGAPLAA